MPDYDAKFFDYVNSGALSSARQMLPLVQKITGANSVLDVGCGQGAWLSVWREIGVADVLGLDGDYVDRNALLVPTEHFYARDLSERFEIERRFDLVQTLEVAEHLPKSHAPAFVASLVAHAPFVLFSAAPPGQGGDHHINEQPYTFWQQLFAEHDYVAVDCLRPDLLNNAEIEPWYRYNTILYAHTDALASIPADARAHVLDGEPVRDLSPSWYRLRKRLVSLLPIALATRIAKLKERRVANARGA